LLEQVWSCFFCGRRAWKDAMNKADDEAVFVVFEEAPMLMKAMSFKEKQITVIFKRAPLGFSIKKSFDHDDHFPVVAIVEAGSEADKLGVKPGFELVQVDGQEVMNWDYHEVEALIEKWVATVGAKAGILGAREDDQLYLVFENKKAALTNQKSVRAMQKTASFTKRPLGFSYKPMTPIIVSEVEPGSEADEFGIRPGMKVVQIDGESVLSWDFDKVDQKLKKTTKKLDIDGMSKDEKMWSKLKETAAVKDKHEEIVKTVSRRLDNLETTTAQETKAQLDLMTAKNAELERRLIELEARYQAEPAWSFWSCCASRPLFGK